VSVFRKFGFCILMVLIVLGGRVAAEELYVGYAGSGEVDPNVSFVGIELECKQNDQGEYHCNWKDTFTGFIKDFAANLFTGATNDDESRYLLYVEPLLSNENDFPILGWYPWGYTDEEKKKLPNSSWAPSIASFNGAIAMAWRGFGSHKVRFGWTWWPLHGMPWMGVNGDITDTTGFTQIRDFQSSAKPHLQSFGNRLFITFKGDHSEYIYISNTSDAVNWTEAQRLGTSQTSSPPSMAVLGDRLYIFYRGRSSDSIYVHSTPDGVNWTAAAKINNHLTSHTPYVTSFNGRLYVAFKGSGSEKVYITSSANGVTWTSAYAIPNLLSDRGPALASYEGKLYMIFRGRSSKRVWYATSVDGVNWSAPVIKPNTRASGSLSAAVY
jgi:hypothetical protein